MSNVDISVCIWRSIMQGEMRFSLVQFLTTLVKFCIFPFLLPEWLFGRKSCTHWESCFPKVKGIFEFHGISFININKLKTTTSKKDENRGTTFVRKKTVSLFLFSRNVGNVQSYCFQTGFVERII